MQEAPQMEELQQEEPQLEAPQPEDAPADVGDQTTDPAGSIILSVVSSVQTSIIPPQGNVLPTILLPMSFSFSIL
jgi:hypothetical protein